MTSGERHHRGRAYVGAGDGGPRGRAAVAEETTISTRAFVELAKGRCHELLAGADVGRLAWQPTGGLQILPVSYAYHQGAVAFRTSPHAAEPVGLKQHESAGPAARHHEEEQR